MTILIRNATVVTMDGDGTVHSPGAVLIDGPCIAAVGPDDEVGQRAPEDCEIIEGSGRIVLPGFVSSHNHLGYIVFRGRAEDIGRSINGASTSASSSISNIVVTPPRSSSATARLPSDARSSRRITIPIGR